MLMLWKENILFFHWFRWACSDCHMEVWEERGKEITKNAANGSSQQRDTEKYDVSSLFKQASSDYTPPSAFSDEPVYLFVDVETTGLNPMTDAIVQVSALRYFGREFVDGLNSYVNPHRHIPEASVKVHGITDDKVKDSPTIGEIKEPFMNLVKGAILVGHNVTFDLDFLNNAFDGALDGVEYIDTLEHAKQFLKLPDYQLKTVADYVEFYPEGGYHDSLTDCTATVAILFRLQLDKPFYSKPYRSKKPIHPNSTFTPKDLVPAILPDGFQHPLRGKKIVFTGDLSISRLDAAQMATDVGAIVRSSISSKTDYLVVGNQDPTLVGDGGMSGKEEKAHELNALGKASIQLIDEQEFMSLLEEEGSMDNQMALAGFEPPEYHEMEFLTTLEPAMRAAVEDVGGNSQQMEISVTSSYTAIKFRNLTAFRLRIRGKQHQISIPVSLADLIPSDAPGQKTSSDGKYCRMLITAQYPLENYRDFLINVVGQTVNRYPKEWDCCSRYLECSDAKTCVHPDKSFALGCGYRQILSSGRIFYGKNRNIP